METMEEVKRKRGRPRKVKPETLKIIGTIEPLTTEQVIPVVEEITKMAEVEKTPFKRSGSENRDYYNKYPHKVVYIDLLVFLGLLVILTIAVVMDFWILLIVSFIGFAAGIYSLFNDAYMPLKEYNERFGPAEWRVKKPHRIDHGYSIENPNDPGCPYSESQKEK